MGGPGVTAGDRGSPPGGVPGPGRLAESRNISSRRAGFVTVVVRISKKSEPVGISDNTGNARLSSENLVDCVGGGRTFCADLLLHHGKDLPMARGRSLVSILV